MMSREPGGCAKVNELHLIIAGSARIFYEHNVFRLDVNVRNANRVKITNASQKTKNDMLYDVALAADYAPFLIINI